VGVLPNWLHDIAKKRASPILQTSLGGISFSCPVCNTQYQATAQQLGTKVICQKCDQKIHIPKPPVRGVNKTVLGNLESFLAQPPASPLAFYSSASEKRIAPELGALFDDLEDDCLE
jgi:hypothetical protein